MKKLLSLLVLIVCCYGNVFGQEKLYAVFEFMKVAGDQEQAYWETEAFWEKIHQERVKRGEIIGWDQWALMPGGEDQGYQYLVVTLFDDLGKMLKSGQGIMDAARNAYPDLNEEEFNEKMVHTVNSRKLAIRTFVEMIKQTDGPFEMSLGNVVAISLMKANDGMAAAYEKAEMDVFFPVHQKLVDQGNLGYWGLSRIMLPYGSELYASHMVFSMYEDMDHFIQGLGVNDWEGASEATIKKANEGRQTRTLKWGYLATLIRMVR